MADGRDDKGRTSTKYAAKKAATERIAAQRAAQQRADRKRNLLMAGGGVLAVIVVIVGIVFAGLHTKKSAGASDVLPASSAVSQAVATVATSSLSAQPDLSKVTGPPSAMTTPALKASNGLPQILYVGAEWCPNCGATRWPLAVALARFGTFSGLSTTYSSSTDNSAPHIPTLSFRDASYKSSYIDFDAKEQVDGNNKPLQSLTTAENALFEQYGGATPGQPGYPFIDFGGKWRQNGTSYAPTVLSGLTPDAVAATMGNATSKPGAAIQASADVFTAEICDMTGGKPTNVCTATAVVTATTALASLAAK
ncbi:MAG TPA: DUF929 family protein [Acidothermaceae bacterium]